MLYTTQNVRNLLSEFDQALTVDQIQDCLRRDGCGRISAGLLRQALAALVADGEVVTDGTTFRSTLH